MRTLAELVKEARTRAGITQEELSERIDRSISYIGMLEIGRVDRPKPETLRRLAAALDVPLEDLLVATGQLDEADDEDVATVLHRIAALPDHQARMRAWQDLPDAVRQALYRFADDLLLDARQRVREASTQKPRR
jgi:transcriptional regulator with XRE-family HTH domain